MKLTHLGNEGNFSKYEVEFEWNEGAYPFVDMVVNEQGFRNCKYEEKNKTLHFEASAKGCFLMGIRFPDIQFEERNPLTH